MAGSVHKFLTKKTFGIPNWIIGLAGVGGIYVLSQGFPGLNSSTSFPSNPYQTVLDDSGKPCAPNRIVQAIGGNKFCCPYDPPPNGDCSP